MNCHAVMDTKGDFARDLRLRLLREHLDRAADGSEDGGLVDPATAVEEIVASAEELDRWHDSGGLGPRPPGRLRVHKPERLHPLAGCGPNLRTGCSTTRTAGRIGIGSCAGCDVVRLTSASIGHSHAVSQLADWFLTDAERGNPASRVPAWCEGNRAEPLIHGSTYFDRLATEVEALRSGDHLFFTDWRGDPDEKMRDGGPTIREVFSSAAERGVVVKGLVWRSHLDKFAYSEEENQHLGEAIEEAGGEVLLDQRVRFGGSHHQKLVVIRHPSEPSRDVAFAGGIDLCHSRRDDSSHRGDPPGGADGQGLRRASAVARRAAATTRPGCRCARYDVRERWNDPAPLDMLSPIAWIEDKLRGADLKPGKLPEQPPDPPPCGPHAVQVLRTYPDAHFEYDFAPRESAVWRAGTARRSSVPGG